uniref:Uncharacterized protein n=1 Tax=Anguilla anguilla TaxID=7936 RepID=A0A0E9PJW9_ANGAN
MALQNRRVFVMACITVLPVYHSDYPPYKNPSSSTTTQRVSALKFHSVNKHIRYYTKEGKMTVWFHFKSFKS